MQSETAADVAVKEAQNREVAMELRLQRRWKEDIDNKFRSMVSDVLSRCQDTTAAEVEKHIRPVLEDARASASAASDRVADALNKHNDRVKQTIADAQKNLENEIAHIVVRELTERQIIDADGNLNHHMVSFCLSKINGK